MTSPLSRSLGVLLAAAALALASQARAASSQAGTAGAQFLKLGAGARAAAMGESHLALAGDVYAAYYNPAGLAALARPMAAGMHNDHFQSVNYDFLAFALPFGGRHALGAAVYNLSVQDIDRRTEDTDTAIGSFDAADNAYALSYAYKASDRLRLGVTGKYIRTKLDTVSAHAFAADFGVQFVMGVQRPVTLALSARNLGGQLRYDQGNDPIPASYGAGAGAEVVPGLNVELDVIKYLDTQLVTSVGAEYSRTISKKVSGALRAGYSTRTKDLDGTKGVTAGFGLTLDPVTLDFAWVPFGDLGSTFRYSLAVRF